MIFFSKEFLCALDPTLGRKPYHDTFMSSYLGGKVLGGMKKIKALSDSYSC